MTPNAALRKAYSDGTKAHEQITQKVERDVHRSVVLGVISESERRQREFALHVKRMDALFYLLDKEIK